MTEAPTKEQNEKVLSIVADLKSYYSKNKESTLQLKHLLEKNKKEGTFRTIQKNNILLDYSCENIDERVLEEFEKLWTTREVNQKIEKLFQGLKINYTEGLPVLHPLCRASESSGIEEEFKVISDVREEVKLFSEGVRKGEIKGATDKTFEMLLNIGIGGSLLGLKSTYEGLEAASDVLEKGTKVLPMRFIANVDPADFCLKTNGVDCETCLVVISSKSFTTMETSLNLALVKNWLVKEYEKKGLKLSPEEIFTKHIVASTANPDKAISQGFPENRVFRFLKSVGGRYSVALFYLRFLVPVVLSRFQYLLDMIQSNSSFKE